jgi:putative FmdB family regulatory protein
MPIYEYHCTDCGDDFERLVRSMFSKETITCPTCGGDHVAKALSLIGATRSTAGGGSPAPSCGPVG